ncbi:MAG: PDZ domain-containing protein [Candidatus Aminicenantes bacterium]|jgi:C-terminal processing protease CtpA/Prc
MMTQFKKFLSTKGMMTGLVLVLTLILAGTAATLMAGKDSGKGFLGVNVEKMSLGDKEEFGVKFGVLVTKVVEGEAAEKAGIKKYDVIRYFNGEKMRRPDDLVEAVRENKPGSQAKIKLVRDGKDKEVTVTLGELKFKAHSFKWKDKHGKEFKFVSGRAFLGVYLQDLNKDLAEYFGVKKDEGVLILKVSADTPAEKAGLKAGDVIVKFKDKNISTAGDVTKILADLKKGDKADIQIIRHKKKKTVQAELDERTGFKGIKILKDLGMGKNLHFEIPEFHYYSPDDHEHEIIMKEKIEKNMKDKLKKIDEKIKRIKIEEDVYI